MRAIGSNGKQSCEYWQQYYKTNKERYIVQKRLYRQTHKDLISRLKHRYYIRNKERIIEKVKKQHLQMKERRENVVRMLGSKCYVCDKEMRLTLHHLSYPNGRKTNWARTTIEAERNPANFVLLCSSCHHTISVHEKSPEKLIRLFHILAMSGFKLTEFIDQLRSSQDAL